jgi:hypothetical protein
VERYPEREVQVIGKHMAAGSLVVVLAILQDDQFPGRGIGYKYVAIRGNG